MWHTNNMHSWITQRAGVVAVFGQLLLAVHWITAWCNWDTHSSLRKVHKNASFNISFPLGPFTLFQSCRWPSCFVQHIMQLEESGTGLPRFAQSCCCPRGRAAAAVTMTPLSSHIAPNSTSRCWRTALCTTGWSDRSSALQDLKDSYQGDWTSSDCYQINFLVDVQPPVRSLIHGSAQLPTLSSRWWENCKVEREISGSL